jgi:hypothetical protein
MAQFLPRRWRQQPQYPAQIDESSTFAYEMLQAGTPLHRGYNASSRYRIRFLDGDVLPIASVRGARGWRTVRYFEWLANIHPWSDLQTGLSFPQTLMSVMSAEYDSFDGSALYRGPGFGGGGGISLVVNTSGQLSYVQNYAPLLTVSTPIERRKINVLTITSAPGIGTRLFVNGVLSASDATYRAGDLGLYSRPSRIGFTQDAGTYLWFTYLSASWKRALSDSEVAELSANPWQLFAPRKSLTPHLTVPVGYSRPVADLSNSGWVRVP